MQSFIIFHTNDVHGHIERLARIATMIEHEKIENSEVPILYFDAGDIEERSVRISNLTKGVAMHRLLSVSGCDLAVVGNGGILSYGPQMLAEYAKVASYPLLLANLHDASGKLPEGALPTFLLAVGTLKLGVIGVTADLGYKDFYGFDAVPIIPLIQELSLKLRQEGADAVILLSHLGLEDDREIATELQQYISLIVGAHTHNFLPEGERIGDILIVQMGQYGEHLGRLDLTWDGELLHIDRVVALPVTEDIEQAVQVLNEVQVIEEEVEQFLDTIIGELLEPLDLASDRECGIVDLMADMLRERMNADVGIVTPLVAFSGALAAGPVRRGALWDICSSPANPGAVTMTGKQLVEIVTRGLDREFAAECPRVGRGHPRGLIHLSGASLRDGQLFIGAQPIELEHEYSVAGSDWELSPYGGYVSAEWGLQPYYDLPTILREALEEYLTAHSPIHIEIGRY